MKINNSSLESISQFKHINKFSLFNKNDELGCVNCFIFPINSKGFDYSLIEECVNVNIRMYNFDDVQCTVIPSVAYGFVTGMNLQLC